MKRLLRPLAWGLASLALLLGAGLAALWLWSATPGSLAQALALAQRWQPLPALVLADAQASLREGGHVGQVRWTQEGLTIVADNVAVHWHPPSQWPPRLDITELSVAHLRIEDARAANPNGPTPPPANLSLPLPVRASVSVAQLDLVSWGLAAQGLRFNYSFDSEQHSIDRGYIRISSGNYEWSGSLQAQGPQQLTLRVSGQLQPQPAAPRPAGSATPAPLPDALAALQARRVTVRAELAGNLATTPPDAARLQLKAWAGAEAAHAHGPEPLLQADVQAALAPWQAQPLIHVQARWQGLNLADFGARWPQTLLDGTASVQPKTQGWAGQLSLHNATPGPWNSARLPVSNLALQASRPQGQWLLESLRADLAGGHLQGQGQWQAGQWLGQLQVQGVQPAAIDSRLSATPLSGQVRAAQRDSAIHFEGVLAAKPPSNKRKQLLVLKQIPLHSVAASGQWAAPVLRLDRLHLELDTAQIDAQLSLHTSTWATQGHAELNAPGLSAHIQGQAAAQDGQGEFDLQSGALALAHTTLTRWAAWLAPADSAVANWRVQGQAHLHGQWQGGWRDPALALQTTLSATALQWQSTADAAVLQLPTVQIQAQGTPKSLSLSAHGQASQMSRAADWRLQAQANQDTAGDWSAQLTQAQATLRLPGQSGPWQLAVQGAGPAANAPEPAAPATPPLRLTWRSSASQRSLSVSAGALTLHGPLTGTAQLDWQDARWWQPMGTAGASHPHWQAQGQVSQLPLAWVEALIPRALTDMSLRSDLTLAGSWDASADAQMQARLLLERQSGDLHLLTDNAHASSIAAGLNDARLQINLSGNQVAANLRWDSQRAGHALLAFSTQLDERTGQWSDQAPVGGSLQMQLPPMDAWSALAPPGWRLRGTMQASLSLGGTRNAPQWSGQLAARDLAVRSAVDGIDFSQGELQAHLQGTQLIIDRFALQGAGAANATPGQAPAGGQLEIHGQAQWLPDSNRPHLADHVQLQLTARAEGLRLSSRPDRRVSVSGQLQASLQAMRLQLRGALRADSALLTLPEDNTPRLGDDVVVRAATAAARSPNAATLPNPAAPSPTTDTAWQPDVAVDLDLGPDFQVRGRGIATRLAGQLHATLQGPGQALRLQGLVRTVDGTFAAYSQRLQIEQGLIRFTGAPDNPQLNILALRTQLSQRVGVQVSGTALAPVVRLYADPELPDAEKLAWLVLGRSPSGGGAEAALLQQAAMALLGGQGRGANASLAQSLGLDEVSFSGKDSGSSATATGASITLGKRLSRDFYVAFESSLNGAAGVFYIFYDLSRHLTLRAQAGQPSALDVIYTLRYD